MRADERHGRQASWPKTLPCIVLAKLADEATNSWYRRLSGGGVYVK